MSEDDNYELEKSVLQAIKGKDDEALRAKLKGLTPRSTETDAILSQALTTAVNSSNTQTVHLLLDHGADWVMEQTDQYGNPPLVLAAIRNNLDILELLIQTKCNVNSTDLDSRTALHWVAVNGNVKAANLLLHDGAEPDRPDKVYSFTPLMLAARQGHTDIVKLLLQYNCNINRTDCHGETPLFDAVRHNNLECTQLILNAGCKINLVNRYNATPLVTAILYDHPDVMRLLLYRNCSLSGAMDSALHECHQLIICDLLVLAGANLNGVNILLQRTIPSKQPGLEDDLQKWFDIFKRSPPRSLRVLCRITIRNFYEVNLLRVVKRLPIPETLQRFLTIPELLECDTSQGLLLSSLQIFS